MRLHRIRLTNFKGVTCREVTFPDTGVIVIAGANEVGKTSLVDALDLVLNHKHTSTRRQIRQVQTVGSDQPPSVEVELSLDPHRVVLTKTWLKGASVRLRFLEGPRRGDQLTGDVANDTFDQLWDGRDDVLWRALRLLQATGLDQQQLGEARTLAAVLDHSAQPDGDEELPDSVMGQAETEAARYFTPTGRPTRALEQVRQAVAAADAEHDAAQREVDALEAARGEVSETIARCRELTESVARADLEVRAWATREAEVAQVWERRRQAAERLAAAQMAHELADGARRARAELVDRADEEARRLARARDEADEAAGRQGADAERHAALEAQVSAATQTVNELTTDIDALARRRDHLRDVKSLTQLRRLVSDIDAGRQELAELRAEDRPDCDEEFFTRLDEAHTEANRARWRLESASARLHVQVLGDRQVFVDGAAVTATTERTVTDSTLVEVPDVVTVRVDAAGEMQLRVAAASAEAAWQALLASAQLADMGEAARLRARLDRQRADARAVQARLDELLDGMDETQLRDQVRQLETRTRTWTGLVTPEDLAGCEESLTQLTERLGSAQRALLEATALQQAAAQMTGQHREELTRARSRLTEAHRIAERVQTQLDQDRAVHPDEDLSAAADAATTEVELAKLEVAAADREFVALGAEAIAADAELARQNLTGLQNSLAAAQQRRIEARARLAAMRPDQLQTRLDRAATAVETAHLEAESWELRAGRARLLLDTLTAHRQAAQARYVEPFRREVAALGRVLHSDPGFDVRIAQDLTIEARFLHDQWLSFDALSTGAREQLVILVRVAAASLVKPGDKVPVILDDALGYSDLTRLRRMWTALSRAGEDCQVLILTANPERYAGLLTATRIDLDTTR